MKPFSRDDTFIFSTIRNVTLHNEKCSYELKRKQYTTCMKLYTKQQIVQKHRIYTSTYKSD